MIEGTVNRALEAVVRLSIRGPSGRTRHVDAVLDTGFSRFLTLPYALITELGLEFTGSNSVFLADGSEVDLDAYAVTVLWDGQPREVVAYAAETTPLVGMRLLEWHDLLVQVRDGGRVAVEAVA